MIWKAIAAIALTTIGARPAQAGLLYNLANSKSAFEQFNFPALEPTELTGLSGPSPQILPIDRANENYFGPTFAITSLMLTFSDITQVSGTVTNGGASGNATGAASSQVTFTFTSLDGDLTTALAAVDLTANITTNTATAGPGKSAAVFGSNSPGESASAFSVPTACSCSRYSNSQLRLARAPAEGRFRSAPTLQPPTVGPCTAAAAKPR